MASNPSRPFNPPPGYNRVPSALFGPAVDLDFWRGVAPAGEGPVTGPHPESPELACMRTLPGVFNVCPGKGGW